MNRRREIRTKTVTVSVRAEFTAAELRERLRLPADARLTVLVPSGDGQIPPLYAEFDFDLLQPLAASWSAMPKPRARKPVVPPPPPPTNPDIRGTVRPPKRLSVVVENADGSKTAVDGSEP